MISQTDERYTRPCNKNERGGYGNRGVFRGRLGRGKSVTSATDAVYTCVRGTVEDERLIETKPILRHEF